MSNLMTDTTDIKALAADMRDLADRIIECQGENSDGEDIIRLYDHSDTVFKAENILLVLDGLEAERQRADELESLRKHLNSVIAMEGGKAVRAEKELAALRSNHAIECQNAVRIALQASPRDKQEPVGSFHICDGQVEATTDYVKDGEWPIQNGELLVYANPPKPVVVLPSKIEPWEVIDILDPTANPEDYACCVGADMYNAALKASRKALEGAGIVVKDGE